MHNEFLHLYNFFTLEKQQFRVLCTLFLYHSWYPFSSCVSYSCLSFVNKKYFITLVSSCADHRRSLAEVSNLTNISDNHLPFTLFVYVPDGQFILQQDKGTNGKCHLI